MRTSSVSRRSGSSSSSVRSARSQVASPFAVRGARNVGRFYLYEVYADLDAFKAHLRTEHVKPFIAKAASHSVSVGKDVLVQVDEITIP